MGGILSMLFIRQIRMSAGDHMQGVAIWSMTISGSVGMPDIGIMVSIMADYCRRNPTSPIIPNTGWVRPDSTILGQL